jgi:hypothetical protein
MHCNRGMTHRCMKVKRRAKQKATSPEVAARLEPSGAGSEATASRLEASAA